MANYNYTVTVAYSSYYGQNIYRLNGTDKPTLTVAVGDTVTFDLSDSSVTGHPLLVGPNNSNSGAYGNSEGVTFSVAGTSPDPTTASAFVTAFDSAKSSNSSASASVTWTVASANDISSFYVCNYHSNMGNTITVTGGTDTDAPTNTSISIDGGAANTTSTSVTLALAATDNVGVTDYFVSETNSTPASNDPNWVTIPGSPTNYSASGIAHTLTAGAGTKTVYAWFKDAGGRVSTVTSDSIQLLSTDTDAPINGTISIAGGAATTSTTSVSIALTATDNIGVTDYIFKNEDATTPSLSDTWVSVGAATTSYSATVSHTLSGGDGQKQVYVWFKDAANNISSSFNDTITLATADTTAPANPAISLDSGAATTTSLQVTASISGTDAVGITGYYLSETNSTPALGDFIGVSSTTSLSQDVNFTISAGNAVKTVYLWLRDLAGNISASANDTIELVSGSGDITPPVIATFTSNSGASSATRQVSLSFTGSDAVGVVGYYLSESASTPSSGSFTLVTATTNISETVPFELSSGAGTKNVYLWLIDEELNISSPAFLSINLTSATGLLANFKIRESILQSSLYGFSTATTMPVNTNSLAFGPLQVSNTVTINGTMAVFNELDIIENGIVNIVGTLDLR